MINDLTELSVLEIIFSTLNQGEDNISLADFPILTVEENRGKYSILQGKELIEEKLNQSFKNLKEYYYDSLLVAIRLRKVESHSIFIDNIKPIRFTKNAQEQCSQRGTNEVETIQAIRTGTRRTIQSGRYRYQFTFQYNANWQDNFFAIKQVIPIVAETDSELIVMTVYTFYF